MRNEQGTPSGPDRGHEGHAPTASPFEHAAAALGALVVLAAAGIMLHDALRNTGEPIARLAVEVDTVASYSAGYVVRVVARNDGGATAAQVVIEGVLSADSGEVEKSQTTVDFVPPGSHRRAGLYFSKDPMRYRLSVRPLGYDEP